MATNDKIINEVLDALTIKISIVYFISLLWRCIVNTSYFRTQPLNKKYTKKLNEILGTTQWSVRIIKSNTPNAFAFMTKDVLITSKLIEDLTEREVEAILLHEVYHVKNFHSLKMMFAQYPIIILILNIMSSIGFVTGTTFIMGVLVVLVFNLMLFLFQIPLNLTIGRKMEYNADAYPVKFGYTDEIESVLKKLTKDTQNKDCGAVCRIFKKLNRMIDEHPSLEDRIENILKNHETYKIKSEKELKTVFLRAIT